MDGQTRAYRDVLAACPPWLVGKYANSATSNHAFKDKVYTPGHSVADCRNGQRYLPSLKMTAFCRGSSNMGDLPDDDLELFREATRGARPISVDQADTGKPRSDRSVLQSRRQAASVAPKAIRVDGLSDQFVLDVEPEEFLLWASNGVQEGQLRKLKAGQIPFDGSIDLHGMTVEKARETLWDFLAEANRLEIRCVRVTHGKAVRKDGRRPILKSHVNTWLRQHPGVLGFSSCLPRHGGTGSLYVLLRRSMLEGRDE